MARFVVLDYNLWHNFIFILVYNDNPWTQCSVFRLVSFLFIINILHYIHNR